MSATGRSDVRHPDDDYATPAWCVEAILLHLRQRTHRVATLFDPCWDRVLDPCCGVGGILDVVQGHLDQARGSTVGIEQNPSRACVAADRGHVVTCGDAMNLSWGSPSLLVTNPPYRWAMAFVQRGLDQCPGIDQVYLLRLNWLAGQARRDFHRAHPCDVYVLSKRPSFTSGGTDATDYAWMVWGPGRGNRWQVL